MSSNKQNQKHNNNRNPKGNNKARQGSDMRPRSQGFKVEREQPKADSKDPRINLPNERTSKFARNFREDMEEGTKRGNNNDISTWNKSPQFLESAGSIPFSTIVGQPLLATQDEGSAVPGIMVFQYSHSIGSSTDPVAVNKCFEAIYSYMVHANSRDYSYDFPDLGMYILAAGEVFSAIEEVKRIYGIFKAYDETNRYLVDHLVQSLGWDPRNTRRNLNKIWFGLNDLILQTRQLWIPNTVPVITRWIDLNAHVYKDAESSRAQMYALRSMNYWELSETAMNTGTSLVPALYPTATTTGGIDYEYINWKPFCEWSSSNLIRWEYFSEMIQRMINKLVASQDRGAIYGDILNAYGADRIFALQEFEANYAVYPEINQMILAQLENVTSCNTMCKMVVQNPNGDLDITPIYTVADIPAYAQMTQSWLSSNVTMPTADMFGQPLSQVLNYHGSGQPTPEWVMEATRFKTNAMTLSTQNSVTTPELQDVGTTTPVWEKGSVSTSMDKVLVPAATSTEIINRIQIFTRENTGNGWQLGSLYVPQLNGKTDVATANKTKATKRIMAFDWHPFLYDLDDEGITDGWADAIHLPLAQMTDAFGDFDNYIVISNTELAQLHQVAIYSAFNVPMTAK